METTASMEEIQVRPEHLIEICAALSPLDGIAELQNRINQYAPDLDFRNVLTRGNWHRPGGVVDKNYQRIHANIAQWAEEEMREDVEELLLRYIDHGYFVTRLAGKTHFFTMPRGKGGEDFIQIEIEELQEVLERPLVDRDWFPDSLEEFIDPLEYPQLEPEAVGKPYYCFRRIVSIAELLRYDTAEEYSTNHHTARFLNDWNRSSAGDKAIFCRHWVLALREYKDRDGESRLSAKPVSVFPGKLPELPRRENISGAALANAVHDYDRVLGYPFAWFFIMLSRKSANYTLAEAVLRDQRDTYDYLPQKDLTILQEWEKQPYGV